MRLEIIAVLFISNIYCSQPPEYYSTEASKDKMNESISRLPSIRYSKVELARIGLMSELKIFKSNMSALVNDAIHPEDYLEQKLTNYFIELLKEEAKKIAEEEAKKLIAEFRL